jgi:hypothetical protein
VGLLGRTLVHAALVMSLHGFRHYILTGENHDAGGWTYNLSPLSAFI